jgi:osmotically-inducible protein OsmY
MAFDTRWRERSGSYGNWRDDDRDESRRGPRAGQFYGPYDYPYPYGGASRQGWNSYGWGNEDYRSSRDRDDDHRGRGRWSDEDRGFFERAGDEVASWFGDDEAAHRRERDARMAGQFRGRGPRNYSRTDERITDDINDRLTDDPYVDASDIAVTVRNGEVVLDGKVENRYAKRRAEDLAESVGGVRHVQNNLRYHERTAASSAGASAMAGLGNTETPAKQSVNPLRER